MVKKIIHRWKAEIELYQLGYVPTPTLYVTFRSRIGLLSSVVYRNIIAEALQKRAHSSGAFSIDNLC